MFRPSVADPRVASHRDASETARENEDGTPTKSTLFGNDCFGAEVLGGGERRYLTTVTATGRTECWMLQAAGVRHALGSKWL